MTRMACFATSIVVSICNGFFSKDVAIIGKCSMAWQTGRQTGNMLEQWSCNFRSNKKTPHGGGVFYGIDDRV